MYATNRSLEIISKNQSKCMRTVHNSVDHNFINCVQEQLYNIYIKKKKKTGL